MEIGQKKLKELFPTFANPETWRTVKSDLTPRVEWERIRRLVLERDDYSCTYCGYRAERNQIVHHIDGDPNNNLDGNLEVVCRMCSDVLHIGRSVVVFGFADLYRRSQYSQNDIIRITRQMRERGAHDKEIVSFLGLQEKAPFKMDRNYLSKLFAFISSRPPKRRAPAFEHGHSSVKPRNNITRPCTRLTAE